MLYPSPDHWQKPSTPSADRSFPWNSGQLPPSPLPWPCLPLITSAASPILVTISRPTSLVEASPTRDRQGPKPLTPIDPPLLITIYKFTFLAKALEPIRSQASILNPSGKTSILNPRGLLAWSETTHIAKSPVPNLGSHPLLDQRTSRPSGVQAPMLADHSVLNNRPQQLEDKIVNRNQGRKYPSNKDRPIIIPYPDA